MSHDICENSVIHVVSTCISSLVRQYTRTMNRSSFRMISSDMFTVHGNDRVTKLAVISGHASQALCGFLSTVGEVLCYVAADECLKEQQSCGHLRK